MDAAAARLDEAEQRISDTEDKLTENKEAEKSGRLMQKSTI